MKLILLVFLTFLYPNLSQAELSCASLFSKSIFDQRFSELKHLIATIENLRLNKKTNLEILKMHFPQLKSDLLSQIEMLQKALTDTAYAHQFIRNLIEVQIKNLKKSLKETSTLEKHFHLSIKTLLLINEKIDPPLDGNTPLRNERLANFITDGITEQELVKYFPNLKEFFNMRKQRHLLIFSTLALDLTQFNETLSSEVSFIGLIDRVANPDSLGVMGPIKYASHDLSHHDLAKRQLRFWKGVLNGEERSQLFINIRKNYLATRKTLDPQSAKSLDILFFDFHHEDTNIFPEFIKHVQIYGKYDQPFDLDSRRILTYAEVHGLYLSGKMVYPSETKLSNIDFTTIESLEKSLEPTWNLISQIWLKSYQELD